MKKAVFFLLLASTAFASLCAQHLDAKIDSSSILIGNQATLAIHNAPAYPSLDQLSNNDVVALKQWFDSASHTQYTLLTSFEVGDHWLHITDSDSVLLAVRDVPNVDTTKAVIRDIAPIDDDPYTFWEIFRWVLLGLAVVAVIAASVYVALRMRSQKPILNIRREPPVPADQQALNGLEILRREQLWQQSKVKEYHTQLTDIVRSYLEKAFDIQSTEMTSDQTVEAFRAHISAQRQWYDRAVLDDAANKLQELLQTADMVKFAKSEPLPYVHDRSMTDATDFVQQTWHALQDAKAQANSLQPNK